MEYISIENDSVFESIKERIGGIEIYGDSFDSDILLAINSSFTVLHQLGIDDKNGKPIRIENQDQKWSDFLDLTRYEFIKDFVFIRTKIIFDPPSNSSVLSSLKEQLDELTWRIEVERDYEINENV